MRKITLIKYYATEINKRKRLPENEFGYMLSHWKRDLDWFPTLLLTILIDMLFKQVHFNVHFIVVRTNINLRLVNA